MKLEEILGIRNCQFFKRISILTKAKEIWRRIVSDYSFKRELKHTNLKEVFDNTKRGSRNYKAILQDAKKSKNNPVETINRNWKIAENMTWKSTLRRPLVSGNYTFHQQIYKNYIYK